jgi:malonate-semialdehyde dehydrogenase (acetylating)/methylmalonate-semialdehyde dehydrogenase
LRRRRRKDHGLSFNFERRDRSDGNLVGGVWTRARSGRELSVESPYTGASIGVVPDSAAEDVDDIVVAAARAQVAWAAIPVKERVRPLQRFHELVTRKAETLAHEVARESGKTLGEALGGIQRGLEVVEFATSVPNLDRGGALEVSRGVTCEYRREPLGVVAGVTPFNFPAMVPMWMFPIALVVGNAFVLKPSDKVPLSACLLGEWLLEAGLPPGVFSVVHGGPRVVEALVDHPLVRAVGFVGSTPVARAVHARATLLGKRALCLGGAKNHLIVAPDADDALTVKSVVDSFTGCAGQRCMAASVLVVVGQAERLVRPIVELASRLQLGREMGALIDAPARERLVSAIAEAEGEGARVMLDGRTAQTPAGYEHGHWLGPTVLDGVRPEQSCAVRELFGPVLSVIHVANLDEALALEQASEYGNALSIFTTSGAVARYVAEHATSGMVGVNVGVPVPRDPFSFGGTKASRFGQGDITGPAGIELWSNLKKITTKWAPQRDANWMS